MPSPKKLTSNGIQISNVSRSNINISDGNINQTVINNSRDSIQIAFEKIVAELEKVPDTSRREDALETLKKLEKEARNGNSADENRVQRWFNFLAETAPDVWQVAIETFVNPIMGVSLVFKKIAERARFRRT